MKIALISQNASPGLLIFRKKFIKYLVSRGHVVYAFALDFTPESRTAVESLGAIPVEYELNKAGLNPFMDITAIFKLAIKIRAIRPDVVLSFFVKPSIYGSIASRMAGVPRRVAMLEGLGYIYTPTATGLSLKKRFLRSLHGLLATVGYYFASKIIFLNPDDPKDLSKVSWLDVKKFEILGPIGLDLNEYPYSLPDVSRPIRFIFVARLLAEKGVFEFLAAAREVRQRFPEVEFIILGGLDSDNPTALSRAQLEAAVTDGNVSCPGFVENVSEWIAQSHVFVLPSYREGFPRSTQEAMSIGRAVITTDVPGCRDTVVNNCNGFLIPPWSVTALVEKMLKFIERPDLIYKMGQQSRRIAVERFDVDIANERLAKIIGVEN